MHLCFQKRFQQHAIRKELAAAKKDTQTYLDNVERAKVSVTKANLLCPFLTTCRQHRERKRARGEEVPVRCG